MIRILALFLAVSSFFSLPCAAQNLPQGDFDSLRRGEQIRVAQVIDGLTLLLADGQIVRFSGIDIPDMAPEETGPLALTAIKVLNDMLVNKAVILHQTKKKDWGQTNRMGHMLAHVARAGDGAWVQGTLLALGLARVQTSQRNPEMAAAMYALEVKAREEKAGLWADPRWAVRGPEQAGDVLKSFQIVEGRVVSTAIKNNRIYLNFGADWRKDFTISIAPADRKRFSSQGLDPLQWGGRTLRVRGWIENYNGPFIAADHPEMIEILTEKSH